MAKLSEFIWMIKILKHVYVLYIFYFFVACTLWGPNEPVGERFLVTCVPASQSSVKTIKKCLLLKINSIPGLLNWCVFIFICIGCFFYESMAVELLINMNILLN